jgi:hypothetical protein
VVACLGGESQQHTTPAAEGRGRNASSFVSLPGREELGARSGVIQGVSGQVVVLGVASDGVEPTGQGLRHHSSVHPSSGSSVIILGDHVPSLASSRAA